MENPYLRDTTEFRPFQKTGVLRMLKQKRMVLGDATGLGKTIQIFGAFTYFKTKFPEAKMIFLTDKSLIEQAEKEVHKFFQGLNTIAMYEWDKESRWKGYKEFLLGDKDILIINYGSFQSDVLNPSSFKATLEVPNKGHKKKKHKGLHGNLSMSQSGKAVYTINTADINKKLMDLKLKKELIDTFAIVDNSGKQFDYSASVIKTSSNTFKVYLECEGVSSKTSISSPFFDYWEQAVLKQDLGNLPMFSAFDEAIVFKETDSRNHQLGKVLSQKSARAVAITATVSKGDLGEAYNIFMCIGLKLMFKKDFNAKYVITQKSWYKVRGRRVDEFVGYKNVPHFYQVVSPHYLGRAKKDVAQDLPAFTNKHYRVEESEQVKMALTEVYFRAQVDNRPANVAHIWYANLVPQLIFEPKEGEDVIENPIKEDYLSPTMQMFVNQLSTTFNTEKVVVYLNLKRPIMWMKKYLPKVLPKKYQKILSITGDDQDREKIKQLFLNDSDHNLLIINSAGLKGLNLQVSGDMFPMMPPFTGGDYIQMAGRISRIGTNQTSLTLHKIYTQDSVSEDAEKIIQSDLRLLEVLTPNSVDEGLLDSYFDSDDVKVIQAREDGTHLTTGFTNRKEKYLKKITEL